MKKLTEQSHNVRFEAWTTDSRFRVEGLAKHNQGEGFRAWATEPGFQVKGWLNGASVKGLRACVADSWLVLSCSRCRTLIFNVFV